MHLLGWPVPIGRATALHQSTMLDAKFGVLGAALGLPVDYAKVCLNSRCTYTRQLATCLLVSCILSPVLLHLPSAWMRHVMNVGVSALFLIGVLRLHTGFLHLLGACLLVYTTVKYRVGGATYMPWIVFVTVMVHMLYTYVCPALLTFSHCVRELNHVPLTTVEISSMHMVLVMNLSSFAWSCYDGQLRPKNAVLDQQQSAAAITEMPSLLEFLGYCFYFPGVLVGPSTRFRDYQRWANGTLYQPMRHVPSGRWIEALRELLVAVISLVLMTSLGGFYDYLRLPNTADVLYSWPWWQRILFLQVCGIVARFRYFGVWSLSNSACILSGLAYNGMDLATNKARWDRCKNVYVVRIETSHNWKEVLDAWNANTNIWLREAVYKRLAGNKKPGFGSVLGTFLASAIWHGIAPGYYLSFVLGAMCQWLARLLRKSVRPIFFANPRSPDPTLRTMSQYSFAQIVYSLLSSVITLTSVNYAAMPFLTLGLWESIQACRAVYWHYHIIVASGLLAFQLGLGKLLRPYHQRPPPSKKQH